MSYHKVEAWILDAQVHREGIMLWLITKRGTSFSALYPYHPSCYAVFAEDSVKYAWSEEEINNTYLENLEHKYKIMKASLEGHS